MTANLTTTNAPAFQPAIPWAPVPAIPRTPVDPIEVAGQPLEIDLDAYQPANEVAAACEPVVPRPSRADCYRSELDELESKYDYRDRYMDDSLTIGDIPDRPDRRPDVPYLRYLAARAEECLGMCEEAIRDYDRAISEDFYVEWYSSREELEPLRDRAAELAEKIYRSAEFYEREYGIVPLVERERVRCEYVQPLAEAALNLLEGDANIREFYNAVREFEREAIERGVISSADDYMLDVHARVTAEQERKADRMRVHERVLDDDETGMFLVVPGSARGAAASNDADTSEE